MLEPTPNSGAEPNHVTSYTYDVFGHLTQAQMSRTVAGVVKTQTRSWVYSPTTLLLTSKTSPESGTVNYSYNTDGTLATVTDANSHRKVYTYDSYGRITQIARGTVSGGNFTEDTTQRTTYAYSGTNGGFSSATLGRVSQITYSGPDGLSFKELYSYGNPGAVATKRMIVSGTPFGSSSLNLDASYAYDTQGNVTSIQYPNRQFNTGNSTLSGPAYSYSYDSMERLQSMTDSGNTSWVQAAAYGPSNELLSFSGQFSETRTYNPNLELTELVSGANVHYKYAYSANQDNGQILSQTDVISGEVTTYQYDSVQRLIKASATGDPSGAWSQSFTFDGFGNLSNIAGNNATSLNVAIDTSTNRIQSSAAYDANGNMTGYAGSTYLYDIENRMTQSNPQGSGSVVYGYDSTNHRVYKGAYNGGAYSAEEIYFYGVEGHKYGTWQVNPSAGVLLQASVTKQWFGNRLVSPQDKLDSRGKYFPFGQERTGITPANPANDQEKFESYTRDSATGLDYGNQRYYNNLIGRFMRPDPFGGSANPSIPQSWNRYAYVGNDPANNFDPEGLDDGDGSFNYFDSYVESGDGEEGGCDACVYTPPIDVTDSAPPPIPTVDSPPIPSNTTFVDQSTGFVPGCSGSNELCINANSGNSYPNPGVQGMQAAYTFGLGALGIGNGIITSLSAGFDALAGTTAAALDPDIAATFANGEYTATTLQQDITAYRYSGGESYEFGRFLTNAETVSQISSPISASIALALPEGATALQLNYFTIPAGTTIYTGGVAGGSDAALQIFIPNSKVLIPQ